MPKQEPMIRPSDLRNEAQRLIAAGQMPDLNKLLAAVSFSRSRFVPKIIAARHENAGVKAPKEQETSEGAPADFPGPVLPNPNGIKPMLDTERPKGDPSNPVRVMSNPQTADVVPDANNKVYPDVQVPMRRSHNVTVREQ